MNSYLFSLGNSTDGPVGYCFRIEAGDREEAIDRANALLRPTGLEGDPEGAPECIELGELFCLSFPDSVEYFNVYINPGYIFTEADIEDD